MIELDGDLFHSFNDLFAAQTRLFSSKDIKANTRRKYRKLPEILQKKCAEKEEKIRKNHRTLATIFNKVNALFTPFAKLLIQRFHWFAEFAATSAHWENRSIEQHDHYMLSTRSLAHRSLATSYIVHTCILTIHFGKMNKHPSMGLMKCSRFIHQSFHIINVYWVVHMRHTSIYLHHKCTLSTSFPRPKTKISFECSPRLLLLKEKKCLRRKKSFYRQLVVVRAHCTGRCITDCQVCMALSTRLSFIIIN